MPRSRQELYTIMVNEIQNIAPELTDFEEGSINDAYAGSAATAMVELVDTILLEFAKTFFRSANGPAITGSTDDLENLAIDHFGDDFARPDAVEAVGIVTFSRPDTSAGDVVIPAGTIVKTEVNANGEEIRFTTLLSVTMTGTSINASVEAVEAGTSGNVAADTVTVVESTLTDSSITVNNNDDMAGGAPEEDDATYRETILNKLKELGGATKTALKATLEAVPGIEQATIIEFAQTVIEWDDDTQTESGSSFTIPRVKAYIADANGTANSALLALADAALTGARACGVRIDTEAAVAVSLDWTATISLNPGGPNFAEFSSDKTKILASMQEYIETLDTGTDFIRGIADAAILAIWGPSGTDDLTNFTTTLPIGNITTAVNEKLIPGTLDIA